MWVRAKRTCARQFLTGMGCISRPTAARRGSPSGWRIRGRSGGLLWTRGTPTGFSWRRWVMLTGRTRSAACSVRKMGERAGPKFWFLTKTQRRLYLIVDAKEGGLFRSDNGGQSWQRVSTDRRIWGRGWYFGEVSVDPKNPDTVYVPNTTTYQSRDGGKTFTAFKGAPGGDDYHELWIDPDEPQRMILGCDQGAIVSRNGGETWRSWCNQPPAQSHNLGQ